MVGSDNCSNSAETGIYIVPQGGQPYFLKSSPAKYISR